MQALLTQLSRTVERNLENSFMKHEMRLQHDPFVKIAEQTKTIEMRLYNEKRSSVSAGDHL